MENQRVLISGAGPVGLSLALCLARLGIESTVFERRTHPSDHPRAHVVNTRTMELFHVWGIANQVERAAYPPELMPWDGFVPIGGISNAVREALSPAKLCSCAQDLVEQELRSALASFPQAQVKWGQTVTSFQQSENGVRVTVQGDDGARVVQGAYLVSAEGFRSNIRRSLGIEMVGDHNIGSVINISFTGRLSPEGEPPGLGGPTADPEVAGAFISMDGDARWTFQHNYDPEEKQLDDFDKATCRELVRRAAALDSAEHIEIKSVRPWTLTALVAERFQDGRIFLVGDAAHAFPPTGGFGMNSGIQDAHNLAWKLKFVIEGHAGPELLSTYEQERQPVAYRNTAQSFRNEASFNLRQVDHSYFDDPDFKSMLAKIEAGATNSVVSAAATESDPERREQLEFLEHFSAIGQELGYGYDNSDIIVSDGELPPIQTISNYVPSAAPGFRAPHCWLTSRAGECVSSVSLFDSNFSLVVLDAANVWGEALRSIDPAFHVKLIEIGGGKAFETTDADICVSSLYGITEQGFVLVRPDGHVAARMASAQQYTSDAARAEFLKRVLLSAIAEERVSVAA